MSNLVKPKDSQWLQVDICEEFISQGNCPRNDNCSVAHPLKHVEITNGKVVACYDSFKGRCTREVCKYYHPSTKVMEQLMAKGKSNLAVKNIEISPMVSAIDLSTVYPEYSGFQLRAQETSLKRSADNIELSYGNLYSPMMCSKRQAFETVPFPSALPVAYPIFPFPSPAEREFQFH